MNVTFKQEFKWIKQPVVLVLLQLSEPCDLGKIFTGTVEPLEDWLIAVETIVKLKVESYWD